MSTIERLDPRVKLVAAVALAAWIGLLPADHVGLTGVLAAGLLVVGAIARVPPLSLVARSAGALPFVVVPGLLGLLGGTFDLAHVLAMAGRGYTAAMVAALLVSVTPWTSLLAAASAMGAPDILVQTTGLVHRYLEVVRERAAAMSASAFARGYGRHTPARFAVAGNMVGALLLRSLDRGDRVHRSMLSRGYTGRFRATHPLRMRPVDWVTGGVVLLGCGATLWALR